MRRLTTGLILAATMICASSQSADAQIIPNVYNFIFGGPYYRTGNYAPNYGYGYGAGYGYRTSYYRPSYYRPSPVTSFYAPSYSSCAPACSPCASSCSPCGVACAPCGSGCSTGNCPTTAGTTPTGDNWRSTPSENGPPKTFKDEEPSIAPEDPEDPGFGRGDDTEGRQDKPEQAPFGESTDDTTAKTDVEALKPATDVPQREGAPITEPEAGGDAETPKADKKTAPAAGDTKLFITPLNVDEKITWRPRPVRSRIVIHSRFPTPSIARNRVHPNQQWVPVSSVTKIVSK